MSKIERIHFLQNSVSAYRGFTTTKNFPSVKYFDWKDELKNLKKRYGRASVSELSLKLPNVMPPSLKNHGVPNETEMINLCVKMTQARSFKNDLNEPCGVPLLCRHFTTHPNDNANPLDPNSKFFQREEVVNFALLIFGGSVGDIHQVNKIIEETKIIPGFSADIHNILGKRGSTMFR